MWWADQGRELREASNGRFFKLQGQTSKLRSTSNFKISSFKFQAQASEFPTLDFSEYGGYTCTEGIGIIGGGVDIVHVPRIVSSHAPDPYETRRSGTQSERIQRIGSLICPDHVQDESLQRDRDGDRGVDQVPCPSVGSQRNRIQSALPNYKPTWKELTVYKEPSNSGKPRLKFGKSENGWLHVSVSHDGE